MLRRFKTKTGMLITLGVIFTIVLGLSYATFIFTTGKYKASELLIGKLNYGISIKEDGQTSTINSNVVTIPKNTKSYFVITITSVNPVDSNYTLAYKANNNLEVKYTDRTSWKSNGFIKGYDDNTYSKKVRVLIDNTSNNTDTTVDFAVYGGYSFNTIASISLGNGYISVTGPVTETNTLPTNRLIDIIEDDTDCITSTSNTCLIGGENERNYVQYPETSNKSENIWRITGSYNIDNKVVAKLISTKTSTTTTSSLSTDLTSFYNNLEDKDIYVYNTNKFNCSSSICAESTYTNIGLLTEYEYNLIGGLNSYLSSINPFFIQGTSNVLEATSSGIKTNTSSNLRPVIYINNEVQVTGSGTASDPYILNPSSDINLLSYTLNGNSTTLTYNNLLSKYVVDKVTCKNGTTASWNYEENSMKLSNIKTPDYCTINFKDGYSVSLSATNGTVSAPTTQSTGYNGTVSFTVTSNTGSTELTKNTCNGVLSGSTFTISNVKESKSCEIEFKQYTLSEKLFSDNPTISTRTDFDSVFTANTANTLYKSTENGTKVYYFAGSDKTNKINNWVKFANHYWRIIRTNHDGSIRLIYSGTNHDTEKAYIGQSKFDGDYGDYGPLHVGYMYGTNGSLDNNRMNENDSTIKTYIDAWYGNNLSSYTKYISTEAVYCNDRSVGKVDHTYEYVYQFGASTRMDTNKKPSYDCGKNTSNDTWFDGSQQSADMFTHTSATLGNKKLTYPVALITADELVYSGAKSNTSSDIWVNQNSLGNFNFAENYFITMTPYHGSYDEVDTTMNTSELFAYDTNGVLTQSPPNGEWWVRPVISIKGDNLLSSGNGSSSSPYEIVYN